MRIEHWIAPLLAAAMVLGCNGGGGGEPASPGAAEDPAETTAAAAEPAAVEPAREAIAGNASFEVDGESRDFGFLPADENYYGSMATGVVAKPGADAPEQLRITFLALDIRKQEIPGELPPADAGTTIANAMQSVAFSYVDAAGEEWAGPGRIYVESFGDDGTLVARFSEISLPHTDGEQPPVTLSAGSVTAKLD